MDACLPASSACITASMHHRSLGMLSLASRGGRLHRVCVGRCRVVTDEKAHRPASARRAIHHVAASSFDANAALYDKIRPSYPPEAVELILSQLSRDNSAGSTTRANVLDLAAGTGIFTRLLHDQRKRHNFSVTAIEPVAGMREAFKRSAGSESIAVSEGSSTAIPFSDSHFDLVTVAQAFHWFSNIESLREMHRVLKKKNQGTLALIWNLESSSISWMAKVRELYESYDSNVPQYRKKEWQNVFELSEAREKLFTFPLKKKSFQQTIFVTKDEVWKRVLSKSYITSLPESEQLILRNKIDKIIDQHSSDFCISISDIQSEKKYAKQVLDVEVVLTHAI
jgi:ubiquinone/menaquinone biosynthesis C-methylase UbiE